MSRFQVVERPAFADGAQLGMMKAQAFEQINKSMPAGQEFAGYRQLFSQMAMLDRGNPGRADKALVEMLKATEKVVNRVNAIAKAFRAHPRHYQTVDPVLGHAKVLPTLDALHKAGEFGALSKATLDVGSLTNFSQITGGQSLGYVSLDTQMARGTVRPDSFTLYQCLRKTAAFQIVDYWAYNDDTGGAPPGAAFSGFSSVTSGTLATSVGNYSLQNINLKLMLDGRAMTVALAAQNSFVDIPTQESANAALTVLSTANYASYWGNPTLFPNQFQGLYYSIPSANHFDFQNFYNTTGVKEGWSQAQALYNLIYEVGAQIAQWNRFGRITHAFMTPMANASMQPLVTTVLNNIVTTMSTEQSRMPGIIVNGDLQGMRTRLGEIQFVLDIFIDVRATPQQAYVRANGTTPATTSSPTPPSGVTTATVPATGSIPGGSFFTAAYTPTGNSYVYAVASLDQNTLESVLTYSAVVTGVALGGAVNVTIAPPGNTDAFAFRVFRSGLGYSKTTTGNTPYSFRAIGTVLASGGTNVVFQDTNVNIPGGETIFLLDMADEDNAVDWRFLLPLTKIELFAQNLYMPWAVCMIGAVRNKIPKFHGIIHNYVADEPAWNPLAPNS